METNDPSVVVGVFKDHAKADRAIEDLKQAGFRENQFSSTLYKADAAENSRIVVTIKVDGRDQQAIGILFDNGANNADLPPGMILEHGTIVSAQGEAIALVPEPHVGASFSKDSFFAEGKEANKLDEPEMMDNPNFPHG